MTSQTTRSPGWLLFVTVWMTMSAACVLGQTGSPAFEVISVKPSPPNPPMGIGFYTYPGGRILCSGCTLQYLAMEAFDVRDHQIAGGPVWVKDDRYDVEATPPASSPSSQARPASFKSPPNEEQRLMLRSLLAERFKLTFHREDREGPVIFLERGDKALKLQPPKDTERLPWAGGVEGGAVTYGTGIAGRNITMAQFAVRLGGFLRRTVLDRTAIEGVYDLEYRTGIEDPDADVPAAIFSSVQALGLHLRAGKGPVSTIVIEHAEKPAAN